MTPSIFIFFFLVSVLSSLPHHSSRRILHEPLFPVSYTPPQTLPPQNPSSDWPFFPQAPPGITSPTSTTSPPSNASSQSSHTSPPQHLHSRKLTFVVSASIAALILLTGLAFFMYRRHLRLKRSTGGRASDRKLFSDSFHRSAAEGPTIASQFLYLGTMEPSSGQRDGVRSCGSPYQKLSSMRRAAQMHQPSPELQPLPPLNEAGRRVLQPTIPSSDEETIYYSPNCSSVAVSSDIASTTSRGLHHPAGSAYSCRTSPRSRLSQSSIDSRTISSPPCPPSPQSTQSRLPPPPAMRTKIPINGFQPPPPPPPPPPAGKFSGRPPPPPPPPPTQAKIRTIEGYKATVPLQPMSSRSNVMKPAWRDSRQQESGKSEVEVQNGGDSVDLLDVGEKPRLKPLHWDTVRAPPDRATVWDQLKSSSFQLNEDMIETLFSSNSSNVVQKEATKLKSSLPPPPKEKSVLDPKKSQNIAILLRALNVTREEVTEGLLDGNPEGLGVELLETLVKMAPTKEEERKLREYKGDVSKLGSAERFLKAILDIPFAFKRVDAMLYKVNFETEVKYLMNSYETLEAACEELKNSRLFLKLLEAVLRTGNRMNVGTYRGQATSFKLDTLLKLVDIKGTDGKTTLLHFVVQEIIRSEDTSSDNAPVYLNKAQTLSKEDRLNKRGLQIVAGLSRELGNVKKAAGMDSDILNGYVSKLVTGLNKIKKEVDFVNSSVEGKFLEEMKSFLIEAEKEISQVKDKEATTLCHVKEVTEYFHGNTAKEEAHPLRIFMVVRDFLSLLDQVCKDVGNLQGRTMVGASTSFRPNASFPVFGRYGTRHDRNYDEDSSSS